jgi:hypothetical protein
MTLDEALRIEQQAAAGALDLSAPRTAAVVEEAHRVHVRAEVWGARADERRRMRRLIGIGAGSVLVFIGGLVACLSFTQ